MDTRAADSKKYVFLFSLLSLFLGASVSVGLSIDGDDNLDEELTNSKGGHDWLVWYTDNTNHLNATPDDYIPAANATKLNVYINELYDRQLTDLNFRGYYPTTNFKFPILFNDLEEWYGKSATVYATYFGDHISMSSTHFRSTTTANQQLMKLTFGHELFHGIQYRYFLDSGFDFSETSVSSLFPDYITEGTAACMDDRWLTGADGSTGVLSHHSRAKGYLQDHDECLWDQSYNTALFYSYLCEQLDNNLVEPERGYHVIRSLWMNIEDELQGSNISALDAIDQTIRDYDATRSLESMFLDFAICNYLRKVDVSQLDDGDRYQYLDEKPPYDNTAGPYDATVSSSSSSLPSSGSKSVVSFASRYMGCSFNEASYLCKAVGFRMESDEEIGVGLMAVNTNSQPVILAKGMGTEWGRSFIVQPNDAIDDMFVVLAGLNKDADVDYWWDGGDIVVSGIEPVSERPAFPGTFDDPGSIFVRLFVEGPATLSGAGASRHSILGLTRDNFTVLVGAATGTVKNACYAGGEYALWVDAPKQPSNDVYDLVIKLCEDDNHLTTIPDAVVYGEYIVNHVIALDNSGSMNYPSGDTKLEAAKDAAQLYVAAISDEDRFGFLTFSGDGTECNEDGNPTPTNVLLEANWLTRGLFIWGIELVAPDAWTSIGDGIWSAQQMIETAPATNKISINKMLLLSDGMENEDRMWNSTNCMGGPKTLRDYITGTNTVISTIAFGDDADQGLLQDISDSTTGHYGFTDDEATNAFSGLTLVNALAAGFMDSLAEAKSLERLGFDYGTIQPYSVVTSVLENTEAAVDNALFFVNWDQDNCITNVTLYDGLSIPVSTSSATIYTGATFSVYHMKAPIDPGTYRFVLQSGPDPQYITGLMGNPSNEVHVILSLRQILAIDQTDQDSDAKLREQVQQGVPVHIVAMVTDRDGPVTGVVNTLDVRLPDGTAACGPVRLYDDGRHHDGEAQDGVYAVLFTMTQQASSTGNDKDAVPGAAATPQAGTYNVSVDFNGYSNSGESFHRHKLGAFHVYRRTNWDIDGDTMPDSWEAYYGTTLSILPGADPDGDGLINELEYQSGTHPFRPDSDHGGETDGSEVLNARCPHTPDDDIMRAPDDACIVTEVSDLIGPDPEPLANLIYYPMRSSYTELDVERSTNSAGPFSVITNIDVVASSNAYFYDEGLVHGQYYYYRLRARDATGALTTYSRTLVGQALNDPIVPSGEVLINHGYPLTDNTNVWLSLYADADVDTVRVSNLPITGAESLIPMTNWMAHGLLVTSTPPVKATVYMQFVDTNGNVSVEYSDSIIYDPATSGSSDDDSDGLTDYDEITIYGTDPFNPDSDNDGLLDGFEVNTVLSDPLVSDSDNDGLSDSNEWATGTSPVNPDDDGDGMPDGWERQHGFDPVAGYMATVSVTNSGGFAYVVDGLVRPVLTFVRGKIYRFELDGTTTAPHPFFFSTDAGGGGGSSYTGEYTYQVLNSRATSGPVQIELDGTTPDTLYYYCGVHSGMGALINVLPSEADLDSDSDGVSNLNEFRTGTDPWDPTSRFAVDQIDRDGTNVTFHFPSKRHHYYQMMSVTNLAEEPLVWNALPPMTAETHRATITLEESGDTNRFYRLQQIP